MSNGDEPQPGKLPARSGIIASIILLGLTVMIVFGSRIFGPGDLYVKDQGKTIAYTGDMVLNGRLALPRDVIFQPATKPPLYNWLSAIGVKFTGSFSQFTLKWPSVAAAMFGGWVVYFLSRRLLGSSVDRSISIVTGLLASAIWFSSGIDHEQANVFRLLWIARPDMLQAALMTSAFACATIGLGEADPKKSRWWALGFWISICGAAMTKGPAALLVIIYALIAAKMVFGSWKSIWRLWPVVGLLFTLLVIGAWLGVCYLEDPNHTVNVLLGEEIFKRVRDQNPGVQPEKWYMSIAWYFSKLAPWSLITVISVLMLIVKLRLHGRSASVDSNHGRDARATGMPMSPDVSATGAPMLAPAIYLVVILIGLTIPAGKRMDYLLPICAPMAILAAWTMVDLTRRLRLPISLTLIAPLALACLLGYTNLYRSLEYRKQWSNHTIEFCNQARKIVGDDPLVIIVRGKHPLPTLMHRHYGDYLTPSDLRNAKWAIIEEDDRFKPELVSGIVPIRFSVSGKNDNAEGRIALYRVNIPGAPGYDELRQAIEKIRYWKVGENPYRADGTVWRDK